MTDAELKQSAEYKNYHRQVVDACVALMGEQHRRFFGQCCDYLEEFREGTEPEDVAIDQQDALLS